MQDPFENWMDVQARALGGDWFDGKVVGVTRDNPDGSSRQKIARMLSERDELELRPEPKNPFDKNAIAVYTSAGKQIGYLEARLAAEFTRRRAKGVVAHCYVRAIREGREICGVSFGLAQSE